MIFNFKKPITFNYFFNFLLPINDNDTLDTINSIVMYNIVLYYGTCTGIIDNVNVIITGLHYRYS